MERSDADRLRRYVAAARDLRSEVEHGHGTDRQRRYRREAPDLWSAIDQLTALVGETHPMVPIEDARPM